MKQIKKMTAKISQSQNKGKAIFALMFMAILAAATNPASADIQSGITAASSQITGTYDVVSKLCLAIGAIIGLVGGIRVYIQWNNGEREITKQIVGWAGACVFLLLTGTVLNVFFT